MYSQNDLRGSYILGFYCSVGMPAGKIKGHIVSISIFINLTDKECFTQLWTLCDTMDCSTPGFSVLHYFLEFAQTHVHLVDDAIQPSHPPSSPSPPALNLS